MQRKVVAAAVAAAVLGGVAGCGSSKPLTRAELVSKANAVCTQRTAEIASLRKQHGRDLHALVVAGVPVEDKTVGELAKLKPPASAQASYGRFVAIQKIDLARLKRYVTGKDSSAARENVRETHELWNIVDSLGIDACR
jgi:hypothetical protein